MKKTIKVIDLYNKYVNGEEMPKKIKVDDVLYIYDCDTYCGVEDYYCSETEESLVENMNCLKALNCEIEIIEEDKKPKEMKKNIKIIDLLVNIANNKHLPLKVKYKENIYEYYCSNYYLKGQTKRGLSSLFYSLSFDNCLNDELEIIEETVNPEEVERPKKIEEIKKQSK